jgi:hypothetical protein
MLCDVIQLDDLSFNIKLAGELFGAGLSGPDVTLGR